MCVVVIFSALTEVFSRMFLFQNCFIYGHLTDCVFGILLYTKNEHSHKSRLLEQSPKFHILGAKSLSISAYDFSSTKAMLVQA